VDGTQIRCTSEPYTGLIEAEAVDYCVAGAPSEFLKDFASVGFRLVPSFSVEDSNDCTLFAGGC
jgi:hypothetical protein